MAAQQRYACSQHISRIHGDIGFAFSRHDMPGQSVGDPIHLADGRWLVMADARLDNREQLAGLLGLRMALHSEATLIAAAWRRWDQDCLDRIIGDFALAVYDLWDKKLFLARDPTGQRPLFFRRQGAGLAFATMPSGLFSASSPAAPNFAKLAENLSDIPNMDERTAFEGIQRVKPGQLICFANNTVRSKLYWQPPLHPRAEAATDKDFISEYRQHLDGAVAACLDRSGAAVAAHLSSGYDSSAVTATAARLLEGGGRLLAFTSAPVADDLSTPRGRFADESSVAALTARRHSLEHFIIRDTGSIFDVMRKHSALCQTPVLSPFNMAWWAKIREVAHDCGATVLLTAEMGNLSLNAGGLSTLADLVRQRDWRIWLHEALATARRPDVRWRGVLINSFGSILPTPAWNALQSVFLGFPSLADSSFLRAEWQAHVRRCTTSLRPSGNSQTDRMTLIRSDDGGVLRKAALAHCGVDERDPSADRRLIEFSLRLPASQLLRDGVSRPLARKALADRVALEVLDSRVRGLQSGDWFSRFKRAEAQAAIEEIESCPRVGELLDVMKMKRAVADWPTHDWNSTRNRAKYFISLPSAFSTAFFLKDYFAEDGAAF